MSRATTVLCEGLYFGEGPRWREGRLWYSDFFANTVNSVSLAGDARVEFSIDDCPSGLGWAPDGSMLIVSMVKRRVLRRFPKGETRVHASLGDLATFHCNDMVVDCLGRAYVGNFGFDLHAEMAMRGRESVLADHIAAKLILVDADGAARIVADDMHFPNGSVITPDGKTLIVGETLGARLTAFDIAEDGSLSRRRVWAMTAPRMPDGIALDAEGAIWIANPLAPECARIAEGGEVLEVIETGDPAFACMLGGDDGRTLFIFTAPTSVAQVAAAAPKGRILTATVDSPRAGRP